MADDGLSQVAQIVPTIAEVRAEAASSEFAQLVPVEFARDRLIISQGVDSNGYEILAASGRERDAVIAHNIGVRLRRPVMLVRADAEAIAAALDVVAEQRMKIDAEHADSAHVVGNGDESDGIDEADIRAALAADERDLLSTAGRAPVVRLINGLLFEALQRRASDVHLQPGVDTTRVRYRVDGVLHDAQTLPRKLLEPMVSRVKVMAQMDIAERRLPQDGRTAVHLGDKEIDLRISTIPTAMGERIVLRLLDKRNTALFDFEHLGMPQEVRRLFEALCERPHGMLLVTGPTGSGKTTTLYAALKRLNATELNIMTLEDPVEYELPGVSQSQINLRKGITFGTGLRHILRQDPDVIMVGEIRDAETARIAIQAALTGHLVFSTLHTNSAASAVTRLADLGVEPYLINASLSAVLAQRLVRTKCAACAGSGSVSESLQSENRMCVSCLGGGFRGRRGLYELLVMNDEIRQHVVTGTGGVAAITAAARRAGMRTLREAGLDAVEHGATTLAEVERVILTEELE